MSLFIKRMVSKNRMSNKNIGKDMKGIIAVLLIVLGAVTEDVRAATNPCYLSNEEYEQLNSLSTRELIIKLQSVEISYKRAGAACILGKRKNGKAAVEPLIQQLDDWNNNIRRAAALALGQLKDSRAIKPLIQRLADKESEVRWAAVSALGQFKDTRAVEPLIQRLGDKDSSTRQAVASVLGQLKDSRAVEALIQRLGDKHPAGMRQAAASALGKIKDPRAVTPLIQQLGDYDLGVHEAATLALVAIGDLAVERLIQRLGDEDLKVREATASALGQFQDRRAVIPLIQWLADKHWKVREAVVSALGKLQDRRAVKPLIQRLADEHWTVREAAASALGGLQDSAAVKPLIQRLGDEHGKVREATALALKKLGEPLGWLVVKALLNDDEARNKLAEKPDIRAIDPLLTLLENGQLDKEVHQAAAEVLVAIGELAVEPFIQRLENEDDRIRQVAAKSLGKIQNPRAVEPLIRRLGDRNDEVRQAAALALEKFGEPLGRLIVNVLQNNEAARQQLADKPDPRALELLIQRLSDKGENKPVRQAAALALGQIKDTRAVAPLIQQLADKESEVRQAAILALGQIKDTRAVEPLIQRLGDQASEVRQAAADALQIVANPLIQSPFSYLTLSYSVEIPWSPAYWQKTFSIERPNQVVINIIQFSLPYWFYLLIVGITIPLGLMVAQMILGILENHFSSTFLFINRLLRPTFTRVVILPPIIALLNVFVFIALVAINPWIIGIIGIIFLILAFSQKTYTFIFFSIPLPLATYLFVNMTWAVASALLLNGLIVILVLLFIGYFLGFLIVLLTQRFRHWLNARKMASSWVCQADGTRICISPSLPWLVRWSGRFLAVEVPQKHDDFADYFVCRTCGKNRKKQAFYTGIEHITGFIANTTVPQKTYRRKNGQFFLAVSLFSNTERKARSADIDQMVIRHKPLPDQTMDYDYAVNAVLIALSDDHNRTRPLKQVPVTLHGNPPLSENTRRILANQFGQIKEIH
ncbi:MAG: hypothetical protein DRR19_03725 [Candidatus Parabeggiatoa sp. nov. 1]|nr:MAG: hypothetical protein DRR19_03725 [Gammaproteobacteria bacterium]